MPFATTWVELEIIILSEVSQREMPYDITYMWNLNYDTNELIYKAEADSQTQTHGCQGGGMREGVGGWDQQMQSIIYRIDKQQGPAVQQREYIQYSMINHNGKKY